MGAVATFWGRSHPASTMSECQAGKREANMLMLVGGCGYSGTKVVSLPSIIRGGKRHMRWWAWRWR